MLKGQAFNGNDGRSKSAKNLREATISSKRAGESIRVICRFRPVNEREKTERQWNKLNADIELVDDKTVQVVFKKAETQTYSYDHVFYKPATAQEEVFDITAKELIENAVNGYNGTIFAYGQTGAGKSFTMFGPDVFDPESRGIIPRTCSYVFQLIEERQADNVEFSVVASFLEIYRETIRDLLSPTGESLALRESAKGVWVEYLTERRVKNEGEILDLLRQGEENRAVASTNMNDVSSRSHTLFILYIHQKSSDGTTRSGVLNLVDLAGSEKVGKTGTSGETLEEAKKINQSLSALGNCLNALTTSKSHVPYRDSKLTHLLKESLGGNTRTTLLIACSPHRFNAEETISTLKFGQRAKLIKNVVTQNKQSSPEEIAKALEQMSQEMELLRNYDAVLEKELGKLKGPNWDANAFRKQMLGANLASRIPVPAPITLPPSTDYSLISAEAEYKNLKETTKAQIQELQDEISNKLTTDEEKERELSELKNNLRIHRAALQKLKSELTLTQAKEVSEVENESEKLLQLEIRKNKELEDRVQTYLTENEDLHSQQVMLIMESTDLKHQVLQLEEELEKLRAKSSEYEAKIEKYIQEKKKALESLVRYSDKASKIETEFQKFKQESEESSKKLNDDLVIVKIQLEITTKSNEELQNSLKVAEENNSQLQDKINNLEHVEMKSLKEIIDQVSRQNNGLLEKLNERDQKIVQQHEINKKSMEDVKIRDAQISEAVQSIDKLNQNIQEMQNALDEQSKMAADLSKKLEESQKEKQELQKTTAEQILSLESTIQQINEELNKSKQSNSEMAQQIVDLEKGVTKQQEENQSIQKNVEEKEGNLQSAINAIDDLRSQLELAQESQETQVKRLEEDVSKLSAVSNEQQQKLNVAEEEVKKMKYERDVFLGNETDILLIQTQMNASSLAIPALEETLAKKTKEIEAFKATILKLKKNDERINTEMTKATTTFEVGDYKQIILSLAKSGVISKDTIKKQVEIQLAIQLTKKVAVKETAKPATKGGKASATPVKNSVASKSSTAAKRQSLPAKKTTAAPAPRRQSAPPKPEPAKKTVWQPKKTPARSNGVKNSS